MDEIKIILLKEKIRLMFEVENEFPMNDSSATLKRIRLKTISLINELESLTRKCSYLKTLEHLKLEGSLK